MANESDETIIPERIQVIVVHSRWNMIFQICCILLLICILITGFFTYHSLYTPAPLTYEQSVFKPLNQPETGYCAGDQLLFQPFAHVHLQPLAVEFTYSVWDIEKQSPEAPLPQFALSFNKSATDSPILQRVVSITLPQLTPGRKELDAVAQTQGYLPVGYTVPFVMGTSQTCRGVK